MGPRAGGRFGAYEVDPRPCLRVFLAHASFNAVSWRVRLPASMAACVQGSSLRLAPIGRGRAGSELPLAGGKVAAKESTLSPD